MPGHVLSFSILLKGFLKVTFDTVVSALIWRWLAIGCSFRGQTVRKVAFGKYPFRETGLPSPNCRFAVLYK